MKKGVLHFGCNTPFRMTKEVPSGRGIDPPIQIFFIDKECGLCYHIFNK